VVHSDSCAVRKTQSGAAVVRFQRKAPRSGPGRPAKGTRRRPSGGVAVETQLAASSPPREKSPAPFAPTAQPRGGDRRPAGACKQQPPPLPVLQIWPSWFYTERRVWGAKCSADSVETAPQRAPPKATGLHRVHSAIRQKAHIVPEPRRVLLAPIFLVCPLQCSPVIVSLVQI